MEAIASKIYIGGVVLVMLYFDYTFYVYLESGEEEQPLLDTNFPDITFQKEGVQLKTYNKGVGGFSELRRMSIWKVVNDEEQDDEQLVDCISKAKTKTMMGGTSALHADAKQNESRREEDAKSGEEKRLGDTSRKTSLPHHVAPLKATAVSTLKAMPDLGGMKAPWDETGRPLGLRK